MPSCTPGGSTTQHFGFCLPADGEINWGTAYRSTMTAIDDAIFNVGIPRSYLAGLQTTPTVASTSISIAVGVAMGNDQATSITLTSPIVKVLSSTWAVGTGNGGLTAATSIQGNQTYHLFAILRTDTDVVDAYYDTSAAAANIPSPYTIYRRLASLKTSTSTNMVNYVQDGDFFQLYHPFLETTAAAPGTNGVTQTLVGVPSGVSFRVLLNTAGTGGVANDAYLSDPSTEDLAPSLTISPLSSNAGQAAVNQSPSAQLVCKTNTSAQIRYRLTVNQQLRLCTWGWIDTRGKDA